MRVGSISCDGCGTVLKENEAIHADVINLFDGRRYDGALNSGLDFCAIHPGECVDLWIAKVQA